MKLNNLTIAPKLGILVGVTLLGLCIAGVLAGYLMRQEMLNARIDQVHAIVNSARNMAAGLQKQVEADEPVDEQTELLAVEEALSEAGDLASVLAGERSDDEGDIDEESEEDLGEGGAEPEIDSDQE